MPHEIADSDAESDLGSPRRPSISPINENVLEPHPQSTYDHDPFANLEFDQFLSPTQRLSSALERQNQDQDRLASSTDKFLRDISQGEHELADSMRNPHGLDGSIEQSSTLPPPNKPKRTFSDIEGGYSGSRKDGNVAQRSAKRTKTYGSSRSFISDNSPLFSDTIEQEISNGNPQSRSETTSNELPVQQLVHPENAVDSEVIYQTYNRGHNHTYPQQVHTTFLQGNIQNSFVTKSSMGGYSSINLDFRGAGVGLDANANPFGSLSQVSLEGDTNLSETERFASLFHHNRRLSDGVPVHEKLNAEGLPQRGHLKEMATSPLEKQDTTEESPSNNTMGPEHKLAVQPPSVAAPPTASNTDTKGAVDTNSAKPAQKKRGRKPKNTIGGTDNQNLRINAFEQLQAADPLDMPEEQYKPRPSRSRAGTVDSTDSHFSQATHSTGRKGKRSAVPKSTAETQDQNLSSELNLSDPAMIGVPKEMYVPRPSKSRQKRMFDENEKDELHSEDHETQAYVIDNNAQSEPHGKSTDPTSAPSTKKKSDKKSKVKRAKTSAAAMLKSAAMYDEEDKDCIIVDEMPAKVKMNPLPEISLVKQELEVEVDNGHHQDNEAGDVATSNPKKIETSSEVKLSVDIPKLAQKEQAEASARPPEPKKRGRKPKKKPEIHVEEEASVADLHEQDLAQQNTNTTSAPDVDSTKSRAALSSKDPNTTPTPPSPTAPKDPSSIKEGTSTPSISSKKPVHSPIKPTLLSSTTSRSWIKPRIGLSKRTSIPSLLRKLDRSKEPPKIHERKEKLSKRQMEEEERRRLEAEDAGEVYVDRWDMRGKDGMLLEWDE